MNDFLEILKPVADLLQRKNTDYGSSYDELRDEFGELAFIIRLSDKLARLKTLVKQDAKIKSESKQDTIKDIIGYCTLELRYIRKGDK